jgi:outer membrane protein TolC
MFPLIVRPLAPAIPSPRTRIRSGRPDIDEVTIRWSLLRVERVISAALARRPGVLTAYAAQIASLANFHATAAEFLPKVFSPEPASGTRAI